MLGQPVSMLVPQVVGFKLDGELPEGATATDLVLTVTEMLRRNGVVGKFVEFYGAGLATLPLADRATIANMAPEYGATCGIFPVDAETLRYLELTGPADRAPSRWSRRTPQAQGMFHDRGARGPMFPTRSSSTSATCRAQPRRPEAPAGPRAAGRARRRRSWRRWRSSTPTPGSRWATASTRPVDEPSRPRPAGRGPRRRAWQARPAPTAGRRRRRSRPAERRRDRGHAQAAPTSSSTTVGRDRRDHQLHQHVEPVGDGRRRPPGQEGRGTRAEHQAVGQDHSRARLEGRHRYLRAGRARRDLDASGSTSSATAARPASATPARCRRRSRSDPGERPRRLRRPLRQPQLRGADQPGRRGELPRLPAAGRRLRPGRPMDIDLHDEPLGQGSEGKPVYLKDIWPDPARGEGTVGRVDRLGDVHKEYGEVFEGDENWKRGRRPGGRHLQLAATRPTSGARPTSRACPPSRPPVEPIAGARVLAVLGDSITTDHISPAGAIKRESPAGQYLIEHGVEPADFNSYGSRRGNHEVMVRGTFANIRLQNLLVERRGGFTRHLPGGEEMTIFDAASAYARGGRATDHPRRQGVRLGLLPRLGGEGAEAARASGP